MTVTTTAPGRSRRHRGRARRGAAVLLLLGLVVSACGSALSEEQLIALSRGPIEGPAAEVGTGTGVGPGDTATEDAIDDDTGPLTGGGSETASSPGADPSGAGAADPQAGSGAGPVQGSASAGCATKKKEIVIGNVGTMSGLLGSIFIDGTRAAQAWVAAINAKGGINCHPVRYIALDDGADPSRHQALVRQLVEKEGIVAFVHMTAGVTGQTSLNYLNQKRIPVIGAEGAATWYYQSPMHFPQGTTGHLTIRAVLAAAGDYVREQGLKTLASVSCVESTVCSVMYDMVPQAAGQYGYRVVYRSQTTLALPDYTSACQGAKDAGAQIFAVGLDGNSFRRLKRSCDTVGYKPLYIATPFALVKAVASDPGSEGAAFGSGFPSWDAPGPALDEFRAALRRYAPGAEIGASAVAGWVSAKLFEKAAQNMPDTPTAAHVLEGLWALGGDDLGGLTAPLRFRKNQPAPEIFCYWIIELRGGKAASRGDGSRKCP